MPSNPLHKKLELRQLKNQIVSNKGFLSSSRSSDEGKPEKDRLKEKLSISGLSPQNQHLKKEIDQEDELTKKMRRKRFVLKDSIHFKTNIEYLNYLHDALKKIGLTWEIYGQFKVLHMSNKDIEALEGIWRHLGDLGMSECDAWLESAEVLRQIEELDLSFEYLNRIVDKYPEEPRGAYAMAMYYKLKKDYEATEHWLKKWKVLDVANPEVYYHLGTVYKRIGSLELARKNLLECLSYDSAHLRARSLLDKIQD